MINVKKFVCKKEFSCNVYVCNNDKSCFIVDLGYYDQEIENYLIKNNLNVDFILLTHGHYDHIGGVNEFLKIHSNTKVYISNEELDLVSNPRKNCSVYLNKQKPYTLECFTESVYEGINEISNFNIQVLVTPGHTKGSVIYYFKDDNIIFTGDTIIGGGVGRTDLPSGNERNLYDSLLKFKNLNLDGQVKVYSGHGEDYLYSTLIKINNYIK